MSRFIMFQLFILFAGVSCAPAEETSSSEEALFFECGDGVRYPTTEADFRVLYADRRFDARGVILRRGEWVVTYHSGQDILYAEGTPVHAIACGTVVVYRPSNGYGTLAAVVEHRLSRPVEVHNGNGALVSITSFLSIYGHIRPTSEVGGRGASTGLRVGSNVWPWTIVGYVEHADERPGHEADDLNGDGDTHLHLGIRLQSMADAARVDPSAWFRGYDDSAHTWRRYFADPAIFMRELMEAHPVLWHPTGSFLVNEHDPTEGYLVVGDGDIIRVDGTFRAIERLDRYAIPVSRAELDCYRRHEWIFPPYDGTALTSLVRFDGDPAVYELHEVGSYRYAFISWEALLSWGWTDADIRRLPRSARDSTLGPYTDRGLRRMRPGSLVRARHASEVAFVTGSERLPFFNWETYVAMGFEESAIYEIDPSVIDDVAYPRGGMITPELARLCRVPSCSGSRCEGAGTSGGGGVEEPDAGYAITDASTPTPPPDAGTPPAPECSADRDCPGYGSGWRCQSGSCRETDVDGDGYLESTGDCNVDVARFHPGATEICDRQDDDCDGSIDETFDFSSDPLNCGSCGRSCASGEVCTSGACASPCVPSMETCDGRDQDCDGRIDEGVIPIACSTVCGSGTRACVSGSFGACSARAPSTETCNGLDDDCDGTVDDGVCAPACVPTSPSWDVCDGLDNDCDGTVDNDCPPMSPYLVEIWMDPSLLDDCPDPGGFRINLWGPGGALQNEIGEPFRRTIDAGWVTATPISLSCSVAPRWHDWTGHVGERSALNGVLVMRLGGRDMLPTSLVCDDMANPAWGAKPYLPLESRYEGSCTPRW